MEQSGEDQDRSGESIETIKLPGIVMNGAAEGIAQVSGARVARYKDAVIVVYGGRTYIITLKELQDL